MSDKQLRQEILDVFQWDPRIDTRHVDLTVREGVVTISGAGTNDERIATEQAIHHVAGIRGLQQNMEVAEAVGEMRLDCEPGSELATD